MLWPPDAKNWLIWKDPDAGRDWRQEEKGTTEDEMIEWHHQLNGHEFEQAPGVGDGQGSLVCCSPWGCKESDTIEWLNWPMQPWEKSLGLIFFKIRGLGQMTCEVLQSSNRLFFLIFHSQIDCIFHMLPWRAWRSMYFKLCGYSSGSKSDLKKKTISHQSEWLSSKSLQTINAKEGVEKSELCYTISGNANWCSHYGEPLKGDSFKNWK